MATRTSKPIKSFKVTIVRTIMTEFDIDATSRYGARKKVTAYGITEAAVDYAKQDTKIVAWIKSIKAAE